MKRKETTMTRSGTTGGIFEKAGRRAGLVLVVVLSIIVTMALTAQAGQETTKEWKLRVTVKSAGIHREQDSKSPVIGWIAQGKELTSTVYDGEWYMITIRTGEGGIALPGYLSRFDVEVVEEKVEKGPGFWDATAEANRRKGLTLKLSGGYSLFSGGDIDTGAIGMFNQAAAMAMASGFAIIKNDPKAFHAGPEGGVDLIYHLNSRFGIGLGGSYVDAKGESSFQFAENNINYQTLWNVPALKAYGLRLEAYYDVSLLPWLGLTAHGGPAYYHANYNYSRDYSTTTYEESDLQAAKADTLGFHGGVGLSIGLNARIAILLEVQVRYARFGDLKGSEKLEQTPSDGATVIKETSGSLYFIEGGVYPKLAVLADGATAGLNARKAVLDISGVVLAGGVVIRF
jgi:hypothetical protein